jgi:hypothetical protein
MMFLPAFVSYGNRRFFERLGTGEARKVARAAFLASDHDSEKEIGRPEKGCALRTRFLIALAQIDCENRRHVESYFNLSGAGPAINRMPGHTGLRGSVRLRQLFFGGSLKITPQEAR